MGGLVGKFWNSFGLTATFAIMVSLLVAFTLTPMLAARIFGARAPTLEQRRRPRPREGRHLPHAWSAATRGCWAGVCVTGGWPCSSAILILGFGLVPAHPLQARVRGGRRHERVRGRGGGPAGLLARALRRSGGPDGGGDPEDPRGHDPLLHGGSARSGPVQRGGHLDLRRPEAVSASARGARRTSSRRCGSAWPRFPGCGRAPSRST